MEVIVDAFWRSVYRLGYPGARLYWRLVGKLARGANIAVWHDGRLLCVRQSYRHGLTFPGGGLNWRETAIDAARRELREEVGFDLALEDFRRRSLLAYQCDGRPVEDEIFEVRLREPLQPIIDNREIVWAGFLEPAAIRESRMQRSLRLYLERFGHAET